MVRTLIVSSAIAAAVLWTYWPASSFSFLNWDDQTVILQNPGLQGPNVVRWAFTTTYMEHYQPLSWLVWAAIRRTFDADPRAFHTANIVMHVICVLLVWTVARRLFDRTLADASSRGRDLTAATAAILFGIHPLRVEVVAWVSALPYALALALLLLSVLAYLRSASTQGSQPWWITAIALFAASLLARPIALGYPIVLFLIDVAIIGRDPRSSVARVWPFAVLAIGAGVVESAARATALYEGPWLFRLQSVAAAPFVYVWRTLVPLRLTPLDPLPLDPATSLGALIAATLALCVISFAAWRWRRQWPGRAAAWAAYLALLGPATGLLPSGLQLTADRYTYLPGVVIAMAIAGGGALWMLRFAGARSEGNDHRKIRKITKKKSDSQEDREDHEGRNANAAFAGVVVAIVAAASAVATRAALAPWADSVGLWSHVVSLDPRQDIGLYNLATALAAEGRDAEAAARYRELLGIQPDHAAAQANLDRLDAARLEQEANDLAAKGELAAAAERYRQALALDGQRTHSRASRGMALAALGRNAEAIPELREAIRQGSSDPAIPNTLAVLLLQSGESREARDVLQRGLAIHENDTNLAHNLARLLATDAGHDQADAALSLKLAAAVVDATGGRDPRALDTMAAAFAANGRLSEADATFARAAALADAQGDRELAADIRSRRQRSRR